MDIFNENLAEIAKSFQEAFNNNKEYIDTKVRTVQSNLKRNTDLPISIPLKIDNMDMTLDIYKHEYKFTFCISR